MFERQPNGAGRMNGKKRKQEMRKKNDDDDVIHRIHQTTGQNVCTFVFSPFDTAAIAAVDDNAEWNRVEEVEQYCWCIILFFVVSYVAINVFIE